MLDGPIKNTDCRGGGSVKVAECPPFVLVWFGLVINILVNNFQSCWDRVTASWVFTSTLESLNCIAQGHYTAVMGFEPWTAPEYDALPLSHRAHLL